MERMIQSSSAPASCGIELLRPFDSLPPELVCRILCFLGPRDVVQLRLVSKLFHGITHDPLVWKTIYAYARLPRPPGPFPCQSTRFLEKTLIRSERLAESWTTQPIQAVPCTRIRLGGSPLGQPRIIGGRWLITFESYKQIVFHDVEKHSRQVLWEDTGLITSWDVCSVTSAGELLVYVVLRENAGKFWSSPWKLLEFRLYGESAHLSYSVPLDIPAKYLGQSLCLVGALSPFLYIMGRDMVFDTRTRIFYEFPAFSSGIDEIQVLRLFMAHRKVLLTNTHIVVVSHQLQDLGLPSSTVESTLIQVFTLPADLPRNGTGTLRLSHEGTAPDSLANLVLVRNSVINSTTDSTDLRLLRLQPEGDRLYFSCVGLTLPKFTSDTVLPVSIDVYDVFTVDGGIYDPSMSPCGYFIEVSDDGHARGLCRIYAENDRPGSPRITKFTINATGDKCVAVVGPPSLPQWIDDDDPPRFSKLSFDGVIGRFCYLQNGHDWRSPGFVDAVIVDIK